MKCFSSGTSYTPLPGSYCSIINYTVCPVLSSPYSAAYKLDAAVSHNRWHRSQLEPRPPSVVGERCEVGLWIDDSAVCQELPVRRLAYAARDRTDKKDVAHCGPKLISRPLFVRNNFEYALDNLFSSHAFSGVFLGCFYSHGHTF